MNHKIYIFDDDSDILLLCSIVLKEKGYTTFTSPHCNDIVSRVSESGAEVVLIDNKIPPEGGITAARQLQADPSTSHIPVIYFTANTHAEQLSKEAGARFYIQKPFDIADLENVVAKALAG